MEEDRYEEGGSMPACLALHGQTCRLDKRRKAEERREQVTRTEGGNELEFFNERSAVTSVGMLANSGICCKLVNRHGKESEKEE